jgi:MFS family permease
VFGAALGPALGGVLTDAFDWRAIFFAQAPVAAIAAVAAWWVPSNADEPEPSPVPDVVRGPGRRAAGLALALASGALVGLLFLAVVELIDVWRLSPLAAGGVVTTIPLATLVAVPLAGRLGRPAIVVGAMLLAGGLAGMALVPARNLAWVIAALAIAGLGYGLLVPAAARGALAGGTPVASGALSISLRHLGLVVGLLVLTPLLASDLSAASDRAQLRGISVVLDAPVAAKSKVRLAIDLAPVLATPAEKGLPDFRKALAHEQNSSAVSLGGQLDSTVQATIARAFRRSFLAAALFALLAAVPFLLVARRRDRRYALVGAALLALALPVVEFGSGARAFGARPVLLRACAHRDFPAGESTPQRLVLESLDRLACRLHETREVFVAHAAEKGVDASAIVDKVERFAKLLSHLPSFLRR